MDNSMGKWLSMFDASGVSFVEDYESRNLTAYLTLGY